MSPLAINLAGLAARTGFRGIRQSMCRVLDWFHIGMKFQAIRQSASKHRDLLAPSGRTIEEEAESARWLVWNAKGSKAVARPKRMHDMLEEQGQEDVYSRLH